MQLKLAASPKTPNTSTSSSSPRTTSKADDDDFIDDEDDDIEDPESLNRTLSEIIEGKRSSTSLIAILNRENSDCDSIKSSSSENSSSGQKVVKSNSFKGSKISDSDRLSSVDETTNICDEAGSVNCSRINGQEENGAIDQSMGGSRTDSQTGLNSDSKNSAMVESHSGTNIPNNTLLNGEMTSDTKLSNDDNENVVSKSVKHKDADPLQITSNC